MEDPPWSFRININGSVSKNKSLLREENKIGIGKLCGQ